MTVDAAGKVVFPQSNRTWQDVIGSRTAGVLYTNSTDREILSLQPSIPKRHLDTGGLK